MGDLESAGRFDRFVQIPVEFDENDIFLRSAILHLKRLRRYRVHARSPRLGGLSLVEVVVALGISGVVIAGAALQMRGLLNDSSSLSYELDLIDIESDLRSQTDCSRTLADIKAAYGGNLPLSGTPVALKKTSGALVLGALGAVGSPLENSRVFADDWRVRATWIGSGIDIRLAKVDANGRFALRPIDRLPLDFTVPKHQIFAGAPICAGTPVRSYAIDSVVTNSTEASTVTGLPNPELSRLEPIAKRPLGMSQTCHRVCSSSSSGRSFVSGWMIGIADSYPVYDPVTNTNTNVFYPPGQSVLICRCLR